jgi:hypothetical protein
MLLQVLLCHSKDPEIINISNKNTYWAIEMTQIRNGDRIFIEPPFLEAIFHHSFNIPSTVILILE